MLGTFHTAIWSDMVLHKLEVPRTKNCCCPFLGFPGEYQLKAGPPFLQNFAYDGVLDRRLKLFGPKAGSLFLIKWQLDTQTSNSL